ncbi:Clavata3/ESR (CLE) protein [Quillaja saponaria]|uniref:Clavata3/ESR (CLE) protein n=1 Tax=Quillaja saponaria TaxID=32244 RepID=A0AAD7PBH6_QUISA|nr:Clavata3/ESR (CLE) protein [Quillaja saponaria]
MAMTKKILLCLVLVFTTFFISETRSVPAPFPNNKENHAFIESAREVLKESIRRQQMLGTIYKPHRISPGGPDPHHH